MWISRRWMAAAFALSVLVNLVLVGVVAGRYLAETHGHLIRGGLPLVSGARVRALPEADRARYRATTAEHRAAIVAARQAVRAARQRVRDAMAAPNFDRAQVVADLANLREASSALLAALHAALVDATEDLPAASRAALVSQDARGAGAAR